MKKEKLNLGELKVKSFTTSFETEEMKTVKGGLTSIGRECTQLNECWDNGKYTKPLFCAD